MMRKTAYEWCVEHEMRILEFGKWDIDQYYTEPIYNDEFKNLLKTHDCKVKYGSMPRKTDKYLERRMYTLVPYNLSPIQQGIQHEHSVVTYIDKFLLRPVQNGIDPSEELVWWMQEWKTSIVLNGGTSNDGAPTRHGFRNIDYVGSLQRHLQQLMENEIRFSIFREPDLGSMISGISFLVDERVFARNTYKDFVPETLPYLTRGKKHSEEDIKNLESRNEKNYEQWVDKIGGPKNVFLRDFIKEFKLA